MDEAKRHEDILRRKVEEQKMKRRQREVLKKEEHGNFLMEDKARIEKCRRFFENNTRD